MLYDGVVVKCIEWGTAEAGPEIDLVGIWEGTSRISVIEWNKSTKGLCTVCPQSDIRPNFYPCFTLSHFPFRTTIRRWEYLTWERLGLFIATDSSGDRAGGDCREGGHHGAVASWGNEDNEKMYGDI